jgi:hypothetical protein
LAAPTLLVVGEVVRFVDSAALTGTFAVTNPAGDEIRIPSALFSDTLSMVDLRTNEEPLA